MFSQIQNEVGLKIIDPLAGPYSIRSPCLTTSVYHLPKSCSNGVILSNSFINSFYTKKLKKATFLIKNGLFCGFRTYIRI